MKAISLLQPWASLWLTNRKIHDTRHWATSHLGWLAVHAAKRFEKDFPHGDPMRVILDEEFGGHWAMDLPVGAILGAVYLTCVDQMPATKPEHDDDYVCGNWEDGRFAWKRGSVVTLKEPIPYRGHQGMFNLPDEITRLILPSRAPALPSSMGHFP